ncbi:G protein-activated inward rectifier potassium channel 3-like isoform X2 [Planococcus citri]|uniref:G protein-activated inward rectifier potassium channel 3-like isoform X2 n=1 Tax=Planococcus citri TaxID=170843 RepID=UPI0031F75598
MTKFNLSASAPDILGENESQKIIAEAEDFALTDDYDDEERNNENGSFINLESIKTLVNYSNDTSYLSQNEKNSRYHTLRSELNSFRKARRRAILPNGDSNVIQIHISERRRRYLLDLFTTLVDAQWRWTILAFAMSFFLSWLAFALLWWLIAYTHGDLLPENRNNASWTPCVGNADSFSAIFLFSVETQHTTGYGSRTPTAECTEAILLLCIQSIIGVMIQAFMVGIVFAKMARPKQRKQTILFSKNCVICQRDGQLCLLFRVGDMREKSHLINSSVRSYIIHTKHTQEGEVLSPYLHELSVHIDDYKDNVLLIWPMTIVHVIDADSPLYEMSAAELLYERFELLVVLEGTTESTGQTTQVRTSYLSSEILWGHRFQPLVKYNKEKLSYEVDYNLFHDTYQVDTPLCSAEELQRYLLNQINAI